MIWLLIWASVYILRVEIPVVHIDCRARRLARNDSQKSGIEGLRDWGEEEGDRETLRWGED